MNSKNWINTENLLTSLKAELNDQMLEAVEPFVQKALEEIAAQMRKRLAEMLISALEGEFNVQKQSTNLVITIKRPDQCDG